jgi:PPOX class probable F420-dependent enzyme
MGYHEAPAGWWEDFVGALPARTAKLAVVLADGSPLVAPVWVDLDRDDAGRVRAIVFTTGADTAKGRALRRDPRVALCWDDERPPFAFVSVRGTAELLDDLDQARAWATRIGGRYMGADRGAEFGARNGVPGELVVRVSPQRVVAKVDVAR